MRVERVLACVCKNSNPSENTYHDGVNIAKAASGVCIATAATACEMNQSGVCVVCKTREKHSSHGVSMWTNDCGLFLVSQGRRHKHARACVHLTSVPFSVCASMTGLIAEWCGEFRAAFSALVQLPQLDARRGRRRRWIAMGRQSGSTYKYFSRRHCSKRSHTIDYLCNRELITYNIASEMTCRSVMHAR